MTKEQCMEKISESQLRAIAASIGMPISIPDTDEGIDVTLLESVYDEKRKRHHQGGHRIDIQLKSTSNIKEENGHIVYPLESKNYNDLVIKNVATPRILILYYIPEERTNWIKTTYDKTEICYCAWYYCLQGEEETSNTSTKTIKIPKEQLLTPTILKKMMKIISDEERSCIYNEDVR